MLPTCCGTEMKVKIETSGFYEIECETCKDTVYIKKKSGFRPVLHDD